MKRLLVTFLFLSLGACSSYSVRDAGDGVYYAESPPSYVYVDGWVGFGYAGPYAWSWYHPVWYSPLAGGHYYWSWASGSAPLITERGRGVNRAMLPGAPIMPGQLAVLPVDSRFAYKSVSGRGKSGKYGGYAGKPGSRSSQRMSSASRSAPRAPSVNRGVRPSPVPRNSQHEY